MCGIAPALFRVQGLVSAKVPAHLPLSMGVLPLTNAMQTKVAAHAGLGREHQHGQEAPTNHRQRHDRALIVTQCFQSVGKCEQVLIDAGLAIPSWIEIAATQLQCIPSQLAKYGRQKKASGQLQEKFCRDVVRPSLSDTGWAQLRSQHSFDIPLPGCRAALPPLVEQTSPSPTTFSSGTCRCGRFLVWRGLALECAAAHVCRTFGREGSSWPWTPRSCLFITATAQLSNGLLSDGAALEAAKKETTSVPGVFWSLSLRASLVFWPG